VLELRSGAPERESGRLAGASCTREGARHFAVRLGACVLPVATTASLVRADCETKMVLQLPPTPADFERVELVLRSLTAIHASTDDIMKMVAEHAYGGFPPAVAKALAGNVSQTATLCRHCQHCLVLCNPRAVLISDGDEGRNLPLEG
jgi:hypothetical protein